jgi:pyrimidine-specific ribonucleoside hydrolase
MGESIPVIMDCDPGHDDAIALVLAHARPEIDIRGICTTAGNQTIDKTTLNTRKIMTFLGNDVPVARGSSKPLFRDLITAAEVHGESGLDGPALPDPAWPESELSAFELMVKILEESDEPVTMVPTGALTNLGLLLLTRPDLKSKIGRISLMGGSAIGGNWTPSAEFNILVDPEAAQVVFSSGLPITMSGLDVTHKALVTLDDIETFRSIGKRTAVMVAELMDFFKKFHEEYFTGFGGSPLHDPCAVAWLVAPEIFTSKKARVDVECNGGFTTGSTVVSFAQGESLGGAEGRIPAAEANVDVLFDVDREAFVKLLVNALKVLD